MTEWNKLGRNIHNSDSLNAFKLSLLKFVRPVANSVFEINNLYVMMIIDVYPRTHTLVVTHAPHKAYDYTMGVADARLMT